jgi:hypothetical protein
MLTMVERVSNAVAQGTRWRATPNAHGGKTRRLLSLLRNEERISCRVDHFFGVTLDHFQSVANTEWRAPTTESSSTRTWFARPARARRSSSTLKNFAPWYFPRIVDGNTADLRNGRLCLIDGSPSNLMRFGSGAG